MATLTVTIASNDNDAQENADGTGFTSSGTTMTVTSHASAASRTNVGLRFPSVTIPVAATINTAKIQVYPTTFDDPGLNIYAEATDNAVDFATNPDVTSRTVTTALVNWNASNLGLGAYKDSPDITTVMQEVLGRPGWTNGNAVCILLFGEGSTNAHLLNVEANDHASPHPAKLVIDYTDPNPAATPYFWTPRVVRQAPKRAATR